MAKHIFLKKGKRSEGKDTKNISRRVYVEYAIMKCIYGYAGTYV